MNDLAKDLQKQIFVGGKAMIKRVNMGLPSWESTLYMVVPYTINIGNNLNQNSRIQFLVHVGTHSTQYMLVQCRLLIVRYISMLFLMNTMYVFVRYHISYIQSYPICIVANIETSWYLFLCFHKIPNQLPSTRHFHLKELVNIGSSMFVFRSHVYGNGGCVQILYIYICILCRHVCIYIYMMVIYYYHQCFLSL